jgi:hypothetical protein
MNAQEPAQKQIDTGSENRMSVAEKESYVRSAVDASPHKIAIIRWTDDSGAERVLVAWRDQNNNLVFDNKINSVNYSKQPETEFGNPELSGETLNALANSKAIEATPLDFSVKHGANGEVVAKAFMAVVKEERTDTNASNKTEDALQKAIEKVDPSQGVNVTELLQPMWAKLNEANPDAAEAVAKLLLQQFGLAAPEGKAAETLDSFLKSKEFDLVLPRTFVESALEKVWDDIRETFPEEAKDFAERVAKAYIPGAEKSPFAYEKQITQAIPEVVGKAAPSQESWAKENSSRI